MTKKTVVTAHNFGGSIVTFPHRLEPRNSVFALRQKSLDELVNRFKTSGGQGGANKNKKFGPLRRKAWAFVFSEYLAWQENHDPIFEVFWATEAARIYRGLKRCDAEAAALLIRSRRPMKFVTSKTAKVNSHKFRTPRQPAKQQK